MRSGSSKLILYSTGRPIRGRTGSRAALALTESDHDNLERLAGLPAAPRRAVERAKILLRDAQGDTMTAIHRALRVSRPTVCQCIDKALAAGAAAGLKATSHRPRAPVIGAAEKALALSPACQKPVARGAGRGAVDGERFGALHARPGAAGKATIWRILNERDIQPHRVPYYLESRDPAFETKRREGLLVYQEVALPNAKAQPQPPSVITAGPDEKPGVQAVGNTAADRPPQPGHRSAWGQAPDCVRQATAPILAAPDFRDGPIVAQVHERHRSREYIALLKAIDADYPPECPLRIGLDNHASPLSKATLAYLASRPNRFTYVPTPERGAWLNLIEAAFSKTARSFLRHSRAGSKEELKRRILQGIDAMNGAPVVMRWRKHDRGLV